LRKPSPISDIGVRDAPYRRNVGPARRFLDGSKYGDPR